MPAPQAPSQRIAKLLARAGIASRREIERMIAEGRIALNGAPIETPATLIASLDGVTVDGRPVAAPEPARLFAYNKPAGLLVTERDPRGRPTIYDRLPKGLPRVVPVGRLDLATEGLLLLTTDGGLKRLLELPATGVERAYRARAYGQVSQAELEELIHGISIDGVRYGQIDANLERRTGANVWIELVLTEGKNREVRRVLEYLGLKVSRLIRTRYGPFALGDLAPGAVVEIRRHDVESFAANPTRKDLPQPARRARAPLERETPAKQPEPGKPKHAPTGKPAKQPRVRADGTVAKRGSGSTERARNFRAATDRPHPSGDRRSPPSLSKREREGARAPKARGKGEDSTPAPSLPRSARRSRPSRPNPPRRPRRP